MTLKIQTLAEANKDVSWHLVIVLPWAHSFACHSPLSTEPMLVFKDNRSKHDYIKVCVCAFRRV